MPALNRRARFRAPFGDLPVDILPHILSQLADRRDWHACALVNKAFLRVATPLLYRTLDSRVISKTLIHHPSSTLLGKPELARYVRHVTETGAIHRGMLARYPNITRNTLAALALCRNLHSMTWIDDTSSSHTTLLAFLDVVRTLPLRELTIRTHSDLGEPVWTQLITLTGLQKVSIWCMEGPPRVLQGWSGPLGSTLTHLELGVSAFLYPCSELLAQLPLLKDLRLKGAPASSIPTILGFLPNLKTLDTEYLGSYYARKGRNDEQLSTPTLRHLTVRTASMDTLGPQKLWAWIRELVPHPGLETFRLHAFTCAMVHTSIPRIFILDLAQVHGASLKHFIVGEAQLTLNDIRCLCSKFPRMETIMCSVMSPDVESIADAIAPAKNLQILKLQVQWIDDVDKKFTLEDATDMMLRNGDSKLRVISIGYVQYTGKWILEEDDGIDGEVYTDDLFKTAKATKTLRFAVSADLAGGKWQT